MNKTHVLVVAVAAALASAAAFAQAQVAVPAVGKARMQLDANQDGVIDRAEAAKAPRLAQRFDQLDTDKDGRLSGDERPHWRGGMRHRGGHGMHAGMRAMDADKDGRISRAEAQAAQVRAGERFERMDANKDGYLDRNDMQLRMQQRRAEMFDRIDANKDGMATRAEFDAFKPMDGRGMDAHMRGH